MYVSTRALHFQSWIKIRNFLTNFWRTSYLFATWTIFQLLHRNFAAEKKEIRKHCYDFSFYSYWNWKSYWNQELGVFCTSLFLYVMELRLFTRIFLLHSTSHTTSRCFHSYESQFHLVYEYLISSDSELTKKLMHFSFFPFKWFFGRSKLNDHAYFCIWIKPWTLIRNWWFFWFTWLQLKASCKSIDLFIKDKNTFVVENLWVRVYSQWVLPIKTNAKKIFGRFE